MNYAALKNIVSNGCPTVAAHYKRFSLFTLRFSVPKLLAFHFSLFTFLLLALCAVVPAQDEQFDETAPPPLKMISRIEKSTLDAESNLSERTKLSLTLMENRLKRAEDLSAAESFAAMADELGGFHALIDDALAFLDRSGGAAASGKALNNFKRLEISLRRFIPRVELMRRELPARFEPYVRGLIKNLRAARARAVEPLFGDTVIPNDKKGNQPQ